ncbi:MAG: formylglycine-generating enzyme family protein [Bacteroidota bacterium]
MRSCFLCLCILLLLSCEKEKMALSSSNIPELLKINAGSFSLGSDKGFVANETPRVVVHLDDFYIGKYEITQNQYHAAIGEYPAYFKCGDCPVEQISWLDAITFCNILSQNERLDPAYIIKGDSVIWDRTSNGYRLPTEAEWEYACKAGTDTDLFASDLLFPNLDQLNSDLDGIGWYRNNSGEQVHPVGMKRSNAFGMHDMHGNVWEWCWDYFHFNRYILMDNPSSNPVDQQSSINRVIRGGSAFNNVFNARSALRYGTLAETQNLAIGFRVARNGTR